MPQDAEYDVYSNVYCDVRAQFSASLNPVQHHRQGVPATLDKLRTEAHSEVVVQLPSAMSADANMPGAVIECDGGARMSALGREDQAGA